MVHEGDDSGLSGWFVWKEPKNQVKIKVCGSGCG